MRDIYLDFNASTPLAPEVAEIMRHALETGRGNPSSGHWAGVPARQMVEDARTQVADLLGCAPQEIVFTSGGREANNHALKGIFFASGKKWPLSSRRASSVEHPAIVAPLRFLERLGARVTWLPVDGTGLVDPDDLRTTCGARSRRHRARHHHARQQRDGNDPAHRGVRSDRARARRSLPH